MGDARNGERPKIVGQPPSAFIFVNGQSRVLTPSEAKRARYIQNLQHNHARLKEAMGFFEHFAVICELSTERVNAIRKANEAALQELSRKFDEKLASYESRRTA